MGEPVAAIIYPQLIGSFIIGIVTELKGKVEGFSHTLFVGLTTGLCGSITTFSGVILGSSKQYFNILDYDRTWAQSFIGGLTVNLLGFGMGFLGFLFGKHAGEWINEESGHKNLGKTKKLIFTQTLWYDKENITNTDFSMMVLVGLSVFGVILGIFVWDFDTRLIYSLIFAPVGTLTRRFASSLNQINPKFPLGTFAVNVFGSAFVTFCFLLPGATTVSENTCYMMAGLISGFCGCLTTISTFVVELSNLDKRHAYKYGAASIIGGQILSIILFLIMKTQKPYKNICVI